LYEAFKKFDVIVTPTTPTTAFKIGEKVDDPLTMYLSDIYTVTANLAGICGLNVPAGKDKMGLPFGMQLLGDTFQEEKVLKLGHFIEKYCMD
jgi:aspartyl-tRNA(Asn)/glutamyl-tRNA(Gln) amidotransferase subunit A